MSKLTKKNLLITSIGLLVINLLLITTLLKLDDSPYQNIDGSLTEAHSDELRESMIFGIVFSIPFFCLIIGHIVAIFIDKHLPYAQRIARSFLLTLVIIYGLYAIMSIIKLFFL